MARNQRIRKHGRPPYDGLFGDSNLVSVLQQVIADPCTEYRPKDLVRLTKESPPTVRNSLKVLTSIGILIKSDTDIRHPVYRINLDSKRCLALTLLAYAVLDDKLGTDTMDRAIADYSDSVLREKYRLYEYPILPSLDHSEEKVRITTQKAGQTAQLIKPNVANSQEKYPMRQMASAA